MPKRTYQPKKRHAAHEHGFMKRMATKAGRTVLSRRRNKGRVRLSY
ncbi:MAG TPA: 50S ribosomal protein L34 [Candidatus Saccharimonadales bacterium]|nr:50S ribosomal protein L34 [Candidatus Saccharimonadales bacterium]